jgi:hypothetical protein
MFRDIPSHGYQLISGQRRPPNDGKLYGIQLRNGFCDEQHRYTAAQIVWLHDFSTNPTGSGGDVVAIKIFDAG